MTIPLPTPQKAAIYVAWELLPVRFQQFVMGLDNGQRTEEILDQASVGVRLDISPEGIARSARDRVKATIASVALERGNEKIFDELRKSMREDIQADTAQTLQGEREHH